MRLVERVGEEEVFATWLAGELDSPRFAAQIRSALVRLGAGERLVTAPDLGDTEQNRLRYAILQAFRGDYLGESLEGLAWSRVALEPTEVLAIRYIGWDFWLSLSGGTRLPADGAAAWRAEGSDARYTEPSPPLIAIRAVEEDPLVVVEGHVRLTALAMRPESIPNPLEILLGEGEGARRLGCY